MTKRFEAAKDALAVFMNDRLSTCAVLDCDHSECAHLREYRAAKAEAEDPVEALYKLACRIAGEEQSWTMAELDCIIGAIDAKRKGEGK